MTQNEKLANRLNKNNTVTPRYAKNTLRIANVRARISELRDAGFEIETVFTRKGNRRKTTYTYAN